MRSYTGRVKEIRVDPGGKRAAWIACAPGAIPAAGQYVRAYNSDEEDAASGSWLFPGEISHQGFLALPPVPMSWNPGARLDLWGPIGQGFKLPVRVQRLAAAALGDTVGRLLLLIESAVEQDCSVTLFTDTPIDMLPAPVEVYPLLTLPEALTWPDFMVLDVPLERFAELRTILGLHSGEDLPCPAQILVFTIMPCSSLADCGVCAVPARRSWKLVCSDGPVLDLNDLTW